MQRLTEEQMHEMDSHVNGVFPRFHPIRDMWLRVLDRVIRIITLGKGCVVRKEQHRVPVQWDGVIR